MGWRIFAFCTLSLMGQPVEAEVGGLGELEEGDVVTVEVVDVVLVDSRVLNEPVGLSGKEEKVGFTTTEVIIERS